MQISRRRAENGFVETIFFGGDILGWREGSVAPDTYPSISRLKYHAMADQASVELPSTAGVVAVRDEAGQEEVTIDLDVGDDAAGAGVGGTGGEEGSAPACDASEGGGKVGEVDSTLDDEGSTGDASCLVQRRRSRSVKEANAGPSPDMDGVLVLCREPEADHPSHSRGESGGFGSGGSFRSRGRSRSGSGSVGGRGRGGSGSVSGTDGGADSGTSGASGEGGDAYDDGQRESKNGSSEVESGGGGEGETSVQTSPPRFNDPHPPLNHLCFIVHHQK